MTRIGELTPGFPNLCLGIGGSGDEGGVDSALGADSSGEIPVNVCMTVLGRCGCLSGRVCWLDGGIEYKVSDGIRLMTCHI